MTTEYVLKPFSAICIQISLSSMCIWNLINLDSNYLTELQLPKSFRLMYICKLNFRCRSMFALLKIIILYIVIDIWYIQNDLWSTYKANTNN